jgi:rod shape-determining protein MreD
MSAMLPIVSILVAVLATAVPWGLPADATFVLPLVVVMMVFCWRAIQGAVLPPIVVMLVGLLTDVTTGGPLGYWGLMALMASSIAGRTQSFTDKGGVGVLWLVWLPVVAAATGACQEAHADQLAVRLAHHRHSLAAGFCFSPA